MRSPQEILEFCQVDGGIFDFSAEAVAQFLTFEQAKPLLEADAKPEDWKQEALNQETVIQGMRAYMEFAWGKVQDHRGLSASRSVNKMRAWVWLLGDDDTLKLLEGAPHAMYGAPKLAVICEKYGFPIPAGENIQNMINGKPCYAGCDQGCGE